MEGSTCAGRGDGSLRRRSRSPRPRWEPPRPPQPCGRAPLNGDGRADLLIGATGHDAGGDDAGAVYGIFGIAPGGKPAAGFRYEASDCIEPAAGFRIDPATADRFVPEPFEVHVDELGNAFLGVPAIECDQIATSTSHCRGR